MTAIDELAPYMRFISVSVQFEGIHCYPEAPDEVSFLRNPHRHMFHVKAKIEVFHDDRELEFILVKRDLEAFIHSQPENLNHCSCEMIANKIAFHLHHTYERADTKTRRMVIEVYEDGENGAVMFYGNN